MDVQWSHSPVTLKPKLILQARNLGFEGNRRMGPAYPTARPLTGNPLRDVRSRNPSKSTLAHDAVGTAVLHKHHPIIRVGAGLIQFVCRSYFRLATEATRNRNDFSIFPASFFIYPLLHQRPTCCENTEQGLHPSRICTQKTTLHSVLWLFLEDK